MVTELSSSGGWNRGEIYAGGQHIATYVDNTTFFSHTDWLGTERARTDASGARNETCTSLAFGDDLNCTGSDISPRHFTGKQRDSKSGLDYFGARYNSSSLPAQVRNHINGILAFPPNAYRSSVNGRPLSPSNQGGSIIPH